MKPTTAPTILTVNPIAHNISFLVFAIIARITPAPPKKGGNNKNAIPPKIIDIIENVLLSKVFSGFFSFNFLIN